MFAFSSLPSISPTAGFCFLKAADRGVSLSCLGNMRKPKVMTDPDICHICESPHQGAPHDPNFIHQKCPRCGEFKLTIPSWGKIKKSAEADRVKISGWVRDQNREGVVPIISDAVLKQILARALPTIAERADRLLLEALQGKNRLAIVFHINQPRYLAATYSQYDGDVVYLAEMLVAGDLVGVTSDDGSYLMKPLGHIAAEKLTRRTEPSNKGFVAMWFDKEREEMDLAYEKGFQVAVLNAGYDPVRVDRIEHTNRIDDEIIAHIRTASFVVADFTGHRGGVYFEAGFALGLGRQVIWTCREDNMEDLHFDIRQYNTIDWKNPADLATRLQHRIEATVGTGREAVLKP